MSESFLNDNSLTINTSLDDTIDYKNIDRDKFFAKFHQSINEINKDDLNLIYNELTLIHNKLAVS
jgi:hypothetical protein